MIVKERQMTTIELRRNPVSVTTAAPVTALPRRSAATGQQAKIALVGAIASVPPITMLHLNTVDGVEPAGWTISDYVVNLPYGIPLFGMTTAALAVGGLALARGLAGGGPGARMLQTLLAVWAVALLVAAIFPTNLRGTPQNVSSNVHLIAGAVVFAVLPLAGWLLARRQRNQFGRSGLSSVLAAVAVVSGLLSTALIVNRLPGVIGMPELMLPPGILQRFAGAAEILLLAVAAATVLRSAHRTR